MADDARCSQCGSPLPEGVLAGPCAACLERLGIDSDRSTEADGSLRGPPRELGPYRLLQKLGEGGMGEVWLAEQREPIRRRVAIKIIKPGLDSRQVVRRFEAERQALALMDHPSIARIHDAGATPGGRPYFVMEYVRGVPITEHCDRNRLTNAERLELFTRVCEGVQHAHHKAVIHRDLKPSNVLVSTESDQPLPKIIDFGVAKAIEHRLTERTLFTEIGQLVGTPEYMSPEQAEMSATGVDTRTDVYSLGLLLYELLVGALPFDPRELRAAGFDEIRRRIREDEPSRPSARVSTLGAIASDSAQRRRTDPASLARQLRGDLDWITMRALEKDRTRRYGSPGELAADIRRHLRHQPVEAGPPSAAYRAAKFVRRHRLGVAVGLAAVLLVLSLAARERIQANRIARERDRANTEAAAAREVAEFMVGLFNLPTPDLSRGDTVTAREILDRGAREIERTLADQPAVQARMMSTMGEAYIKLGLYDEAESLLERALDLPLDAAALEFETLRIKHTLGILRDKQGRYDEAEALYAETLEGFRRLQGDDHPDTLRSMHNLAVAYSAQGRFDEAETLYMETVADRRRVLGPDDPETLRSQNNLAALYLRQGRYEDAERLYLEILAARRRVLGDDHPDTLMSNYSLARLYLFLDRIEDTERLCRDSLDLATRVMGPEHPRTMLWVNLLAVAYQHQERYDEAEPLLVRVFETEKERRGAEHPHTLAYMANLGANYSRQGRHDLAEPILRENVAINERVLGEHHPQTLDAKNTLGLALRDAGQFREAEEVFRACLRGREIAVGRDHPDTAGAMINLANMYPYTEAYDEARSLLEGARRILEETVGPDHPTTAEVRQVQAELTRYLAERAATD